MRKKQSMTSLTLSDVGIHSELTGCVVCDKPLIYYPIADALKSNLFDHIFVSTDSENIAKTSIKYGASVPFLRPKKFANQLLGLTSANLNSKRVFKI